jgi:hypothetical protein
LQLVHQHAHKITMPPRLRISRQAARSCRALASAEYGASVARHVAVLQVNQHQCGAGQID